MKIGDLVKINNDPTLLEEAGLEALMESLEIFDITFTISNSWNDGWYKLDSNEGLTMGYAFPEELLTKQL